MTSGYSTWSETAQKRWDDWDNMAAAAAGNRIESQVDAQVKQVEQPAPEDAVKPTVFRLLQSPDLKAFFALTPEHQDAIAALFEHGLV